MQTKIHYIGVIELERPPYKTAVNVYATNVAAARQKYEIYCNSIGGYIVNLYPMTNARNRELYGTIASTVPTV